MKSSWRALFASGSSSLLTCVMRAMFTGTQHARIVFYPTWHHPEGSYRSAFPARFRLRRPLLALKRDAGDRPIFRNLCVGAIIEVVSEVRDSGLVEVLFEGAIYTVFYADIVERGDAVNNDGGNGSSGQVNGAGDPI